MMVVQRDVFALLVVIVKHIQEGIPAQGWYALNVEQD